jgi:hypothetical protein
MVVAVVRVALMAVVALVALVGTAAQEPARAQSTRKLFLPMATRGVNLNAPVRFASTLTGSGVRLTRNAPAAGATETTQTVPAYADARSFDFQYDNGRFSFAVELGAPTSEIPSNGTFQVDMIGRFTDVATRPAVAFAPYCGSFDNVRQLQVDDFFPNEILEIRANQVGGGEEIPFTGRYASDHQGAASFLIEFGSESPKTWDLRVGGQQSGLVATTRFESVPVDTPCPTQPPVTPPGSSWSTGPAYLANSTFDVRVSRVEGAWSGQVLLWNGAEWIVSGTFTDYGTSGSSISGTATLTQLGRGSIPVTPTTGVHVGLLVGYFAPGATTGVGKPALLDPQRGPIGLMSMDQNQILGSSPPAPHVQVWLGCGSGSAAGFAAPGCSNRQASQLRLQPPVLVTATGTAPPTQPQSSIFISQGGNVSLTPYGVYDTMGIAWSFMTIPAGLPISSRNIPTCVDPLSWGVHNGLSPSGCELYLQHTPNYVQRLQDKSDPILSPTDLPPTVPGTYVKLVTKTALAEYGPPLDGGFYYRLTPNSSTSMPFQFYGPWGEILVPMRMARGPYQWGDN